MNPIKGLVVHPRIVIASPIPGIIIAQIKQRMHIIIVVKIFAFFPILLLDSDLQLKLIISSKASLAGSTHIGAAANIAKTRPIIAILIPQFLYGISKIFCLSSRVLMYFSFQTRPRYPNAETRIYITTTKPEPEVTTLFILL